MEIAIIHDELVRRGGAEQVTYLMHKAFPDAPIYTSCYNPDATYAEFKDCDIRTSWLNKFIHNEKNLKRFFFPFSFWAVRALKLDEYDMILMSTTTYAKFINPKKAMIVSFCHYPFRLAWFPKSYDMYTNTKGIKRWVFDKFIHILKKMDFKAAQRMDYIMTNTPKIKDIIENCYHPKNEIKVISASIICNNFYVDKNPSQDFYLVVSRIEPYKKVDLVIEAFNRTPNKKLIIVGKGSQKTYCQSIANKNIEFREGITAKEMANLYANCKAFIFPQEEDYGLTPIEANASGRPVIAYGKGGVTFTTIPYIDDSKKCTAIYFEEQNIEKLTESIQLCDSLDFDSQFIRKHAEQFDENKFIEKIKAYVSEKYDENKIKNI